MFILKFFKVHAATLSANVYVFGVYLCAKGKLGKFPAHTFSSIRMIGMNKCAGRPSGLERMAPKFVSRPKTRPPGLGLSRHDLRAEITRQVNNEIAEFLGLG